MVNTRLSRERPRTASGGVRREAPRTDASVSARSGTGRTDARSQPGGSQRIWRWALCHDGGSRVAWPSGLAVMTSAGHPPPLWYRAPRHEWNWLETKRASVRGDWPVGRLVCSPTSPTTGWSSTRNRETLSYLTATVFPKPVIQMEMNSAGTA